MLLLGFGFGDDGATEEDAAAAAAGFGEDGGRGDADPSSRGRVLLSTVAAGDAARTAGVDEAAAAATAGAAVVSSVCISAGPSSAGGFSLDVARFATTLATRATAFSFGIGAGAATFAAAFESSAG